MPPALTALGLTLCQMHALLQPYTRQPDLPLPVRVEIRALLAALDAALQTLEGFQAAEPYPDPEA